MNHIKNDGRIFNIINMIFITIMTLIVLYPLVFVVSASISNPELVATGKVWLLPRGINFVGYKRVFQDPEIMIGYRNTIFYTFFGTLLNLAVTLPAAYALSKKKLIGRNVIMFLFTFTMFFQGGMIPTYLTIKSYGLANTWFVLPLIGVVSTYNLIVARTFFATSIPQELEEAAMIDGYSTTRMFLTVVLPLSKALIGVQVLYYGVGHWNAYFNAMIYITDRSKVTLQLVLREILIDSQQKSAMVDLYITDTDMADLERKIAELIKFSVMIVSSLPVIIVYPFLQKYFDKGVLLGSIKG